VTTAGDAHALPAERGFDRNGASAAEVTALTVSAAGIWPVKKFDLSGYA
jgi:hypothetical protein